MSMRDPADRVTRQPATNPPFRGRGSGREAWIDFAVELGETNARLFDLVDQQSGVIRTLQAEVELLRRQIATRKPPGGRAPTPPAVVERIEDEISRGGSDRGIAMHYGVSHMNVWRIRKRLLEREKVASLAP